MKYTCEPVYLAIPLLLPSSSTDEKEEEPGTKKIPPFDQESLVPTEPWVLSSPSFSRWWTWHQALGFVGGAFMGVCFSVAGFYVLTLPFSTVVVVAVGSNATNNNTSNTNNNNSSNTNDMTYLQILFYSLAWSTLTTLVSYLTFAVVWKAVVMLSSLRQEQHCPYHNDCNDPGKALTTTTTDADDDDDEAEADMHQNEQVVMSFQTEYAFAIGVFLGFCASCTVTDVLYGISLQCVVLTVVVAVAWASLMLYCASRVVDHHNHHNHNHMSETDATVIFDAGVVRRGTVLPTVLV
jgi:hypothetical protein